MKKSLSTARAVDHAHLPESRSEALGAFGFTVFRVQGFRILGLTGFRVKGLGCTGVVGRGVHLEVSGLRVEG